MAAAFTKLSLTFVLLLSAFVVSGEIGGAMAATDCSTVRCIQGGYITCDNYPYQKLDGCACVCAPKNGRNCVLHLQSGSTYNCGDKKKE
ncbi:uncharacterized protein LOC8059942 [Sorghum bicolor]|uniref:Uncharacterized protein n=1 Tax=Sorghum bicolor TaxID=4558 RepID=C5WLX0_SORBI|nr:uncharacterized protein LOC8059942 [Sorghum bicolor]EER93508.1 hypothetical protein SORBI_3001G101200 [Sorghum bicolor]|eukprot:XP_002466510.1 uncharacterized protein LOC8059942 [Sorghum bicolor]